MSTLAYLTELRERGVVVRLADDGESLAVSAAKGSLDAAGRDELAARKAEVLAFLIDAAGAVAAPVAPLTRRDPGTSPQLSAAQERVWSLYRLSGGTDGGLNIPVAWELRGSLDADRLLRCLDLVVARQEALRTRFVDDAGTARLDILERVDSEIETIPITDPEEAQAVVTAFCEQPFDLAHGVFRVGLATLAPDHHILAMAFHQIVFDWGAANPLVAELSARYNASGDPAELAVDPIEVDYLDFSAWQHEWLATEAAEKQDAYWSSQLEQPYVALPLARGDRAHPRDAVTCRHWFELDVETSEALQALAQANGATAFMALLGPWQALLAGFGDADEALTFTMMGLNRPELKRLVGLFANPLPLRVGLDDDPTPAALIRRVGEAAVGAFANQDLPLERVIERVGTTQGGQSGLFQNLFIFQHEPTTPLELAGAEASLLTLGSHAPGFELRLFAEQTPGGVRGWLEHGSDRLAAERGRALVDAYVALLRACVATPEVPISTLLAITAEQKAEADGDAAGSVDVAAFVAPRTEVEVALAEIWSDAFGRELGIDDDFFAAGGHSLMAVAIFTAVADRFDRQLPLATLYEAPTIRELAPVIEDESWQLEWTSLVPIKPGGSRTPIFCVAALGDEIIQFAELAALLSDDQPFYGLQQGLERTDVIRTTIPEIAAHYLTEIRTVQPTGPYVIAGYCWGALVAYEMAQQLEADGERLDFLLMVEGEAPGGMYVARRSLRRRVVTGLAGSLRAGPIRTLRYAGKRLGKWWRWKAWTRLRHLLHRGFDRAGLELPDSLRDILQINAQAADDYAPAMVPYDGDIHVLRAEVTAPGYIYEARLGWDRLVTGEIGEHWLPGDHEGIWKTPNVQVFAKQLEMILEAPQVPVRD